MAFDPTAFANSYAQKPSSTGSFDPTAFAQKYQTNKTTTSSFNPTAFASKYGGGSKGLDTSTGLYNLATKSGLKSQADNILAQQTGEKTKQIFSGGFISDSFDALSALQYGVVGVLKGKSFSEGVRTRQSFTDQDALGDKGLPGVIAGIALDIAFDPLTYIAPETIIKKIPLAEKLIKGAKAAAFGKTVTKGIEGTDKTYQAVEGGSKVGRYLVSKLAYVQGADPIFREGYERSIKNVAVSTQSVVDLAKHVANLAPETAAKLLKKDTTGRFARVGLTELKKVLKPEEFEPVAKLYQRLDDLGKEAVGLGLLSKDKFEENMGEYIKNAYTEFETSKSKGLFGFAKMGIKGIKSRVEELTPEKMKELGQIDNPAYLLLKSTVDLIRDVENAKLFREVATKFGTDVAQDGFTKLPQGTRLGELAGKYVPDHMAQYMTDIISPAKDTVAKQLVASFKFAKVIMNPGTHARNIVSNKLLNYWKLGMNPLDPRVIASDLEAGKEIFKGTGKWTEEARPLGYNLNTFAAAEMKGLLDGPEMSAFGKGTKQWASVKKKLGDIYQAEENHAKLSAYIFNRKKGISPEEAWKTAESATFNYAQVTPFVRKLRESIFGFPFITFTVKSTPVVLETALKNPNRISVIGKIKQGIEQLADVNETERERNSEPSWVKDGFYVKLPIKDKEGRSSYFDLTYILPYGDILTGNFLERGQNMQTGLPESQANALMKKSPFIQFIMEISKNQDFYGNKLWKESDSSEQQLLDLSRHITKTLAPPLVADQIPGGYNDKGERQQRGIVGALTPQDKANQQRTLMQELLRNVGAKVQPIDADIQETYTEWNKKKALENLLRENEDKSNLNQFSRVYVPKKK